MKLAFFLVLCVLAMGGFFCEASENNSRQGDGDADSDSDTDSDSDSDTDSDSDSDTDTKIAPTDGRGCSSMDILFIIDNSGSMMEEQSNLAENFPKFVEVLDDYYGSSNSELSYRVGVTTAGVNRNFQLNALPGVNTPMFSVGANGQLVGKAKCNLGANPWADGPAPGVVAQFSCMANVGSDGLGFEMPFAALNLALGKHLKPGGANEGFYRKEDDSLLVIVFITDEDDCSVKEGGLVKGNTSTSTCVENGSPGMVAVEDTKQFLDDLTGGAGRYVVVSIAGVKKCTSVFGEAYQASRLLRLVDMCSDYGVIGDICSGDLWESLKKALDVMQQTCNDFSVV